MNPENELKGEHYNLRWTNYLNNLSQIVFEHHLSEQLVDVTLVCEGQYIKAHKLVLSACSNFFHDMFKENNTLIQVSSSVVHPVIVMNGIRLHYLKHIIDFMYQGEIKVLDSDLEGVLALGESLQVKGLCSVKFKTKVSVNNDLRTAEESVSPAPPQPTQLKRQTVDSKTQSESQKTNVPPSTNFSKSVSNNFAPVVENLSSNKLQDEPKNYSKVSLDALEESSSVIQHVNNPAKKKKNEKIVKTPPVIGQPIKLEDDAREPICKKPKVIPPPLVIRKSDMIKVRSAASMEATHRGKSPVKKNGKADKVNNAISPPITVDLEKDNKNEIPRPPNAFMIFTNEWRKKLAVEHPDENSKDISIRLGSLWKSLSPETKETYYSAALKALKEHELQCQQTSSKPQPLKKRKIIISAIKKSENIGSCSESLNTPNDDLEIIEPPNTLESNLEDSNSRPLST